VGFEAVVLTWTHRSDRSGQAIGAQGFTGSALRVGARTWIGARALLLPGASVGPDAIVGAGAVVPGPVRANSVVAGNPARYIRDRS
jgi:maltose O-acetyltransferase